MLNLDILEETTRMGLPSSPLDKMRKSGEINNQPLQSEADNFWANVKTFEETSPYLNYGAAIFYITTHKDSSTRGFDDVTCRKVLSNLERSRYIAGILLQCFKGFHKRLAKVTDYNKRREYHLIGKKQQETQESHIEKIMRKKIFKNVQVLHSKASKLDIMKETGNDFFRKYKQSADTGVVHSHAPKTQILAENEQEMQFHHK